MTEGERGRAPLLPCPFCGNAAVRLKWVEAMDEWMVVCQWCLAYVEEHSWNRRHGLAPLSKEQQQTQGDITEGGTRYC